MSTFTWLPDYGATATRVPRTKTSKFGDGYEQRVPDGINTLAQVWDLEFIDRDVTEIDEIENFLIALGGVSNFDWTPPRSVTPGRYICRSWTRTPRAALIDTISARFEQVFDNI